MASWTSCQIDFLVLDRYQIDYQVLGNHQVIITMLKFNLKDFFKYLKHLDISKIKCFGGGFIGKYKKGWKQNF